MRTIYIDIHKQGEKISPELHGHFIEFLGNCIYDGIWVGEDSPIPNYKGVRKDVADAMKRIAPPIIRWPGGCYADVYHWRDGIGKREERPVTYNENFMTFELDTNQFGLHEFIGFCELVGAKAWLNINMMSGSVKEMREWMEYCNRAETTSLTLERRQNGSEAPFNVEYWGIGNEVWGGGGTMTAAQYAAEYRKHATAVPLFKRPWEEKEAKITEGTLRESSVCAIKKIACGPDGNKPKERVQWTNDFFKELKNYRMPLLDGYDLHFYNWNLDGNEKSETEFTKAGWDRVIAGSMELEEVIREQYQLVQEGLISETEPEGSLKMRESKCDLILGEWGNWHGAAFKNRPALYQQCTMRDAVTTALTLDILHRNCDKVKMACVAQSVNVLNSLFLTEGEKCILTPNFDVFEMYRVHRNAVSIPIVGTQGADCVYTFASRKENCLYVNMINTSYDESRAVCMEFGDDVRAVEAVTLAGDEPDAYNSFEHPDRIRAVKSKLPEPHGQGWKTELPAASVSVYRFELEEDI